MFFKLLKYILIISNLLLADDITNNISSANKINKEYYDYNIYIFYIAISIIIFLIIGYIQLKKYNKKLKDNIAHVIKDLEEQNKALQSQQKNLSQALKNFEVLFDVVQEGIIIFDDKLNLIQINKSALNMLGIDSSHLQNLSFEDFIQDKDKDRIRVLMKQNYSIPSEIDILRYDKKIITVLASGRFITFGGKKVRMSTIFDITELKEKDKQLLQQSKLAQMGEMISMIAHQWRQPLNVISGLNMIVNTKLALGETLDYEGYQNISKDISKQIDYMSKTIDDFRDFYKPDKDMISIEFDELVKSTLNIMGKPLLYKHIEIIEELNCKDKVKVFKNQFSQVILNILKNAKDVFEEREVLKPKIIVKTYKQNHEVVLEIIDNGGGVDENIIKNIFDPYFSTKKEKQGTGIGLYMSKMIIEKHHFGILNALNVNDGVKFIIKIKG